MPIKTHSENRSVADTFVHEQSQKAHAMGFKADCSLVEHLALHDRSPARSARAEIAIQSLVDPQQAHQKSRHFVELAPAADALISAADRDHRPCVGSYCQPASSCKVCLDTDLCRHEARRDVQTCFPGILLKFLQLYLQLGLQSLVQLRSTLQEMCPLLTHCLPGRDKSAGVSSNTCSKLCNSSSLNGMDETAHLWHANKCH